MKNETLNLANEYLLKSEHISYPINLKTLKELYAEQNFSLMSYSEAKEIIKEYSLPAASVKNAFMFVSKDHSLKCIFYRDELSKSDIIFCATYFLGKIVLEKLKSGIFPIILDAKAEFQTADSATKFALEMLAPTALLKSKNIHTLMQIKNFTRLNNYYCLQILKNLRSEQKSDYAVDVAKMLATKVRPSINAFIFYMVIICIIAVAGLCLLSQNTNIFIKNSSEELQWYVDTDNIYHKYSDCFILKEQLFVKGPVTKNADDINNECVYCKERRINNE